MTSSVYIHYREIVIRKTAKDAVFYNITLKGLDSVLQAYHAHLVVEKCTDTNTGNLKT